MNDAAEFNLALDLAEERIDRACARCAGDKREKLATLFPRRARIAHVNLFVACFCEQGDLLGQWRGYSGENHGYSLGMNSFAIAKTG